VEPCLVDRHVGQTPKGNGAATDLYAPSKLNVDVLPVLLLVLVHRDAEVSSVAIPLASFHFQFLRYIKFFVYTLLHSVLILIYVMLALLGTSEKSCTRPVDRR
jgi:hypothetical protein